MLIRYIKIILYNFRVSLAGAALYIFILFYVDYFVSEMFDESTTYYFRLALIFVFTSLITLLLITLSSSYSVPECAYLFIAWILTFYYIIVKMRAIITDFKTGNFIKPAFDQNVPIFTAFSLGIIVTCILVRMYYDPRKDKDKQNNNFISFMQKTGRYVIISYSFYFITNYLFYQQSGYQNEPSVYVIPFAEYFSSLRLEKFSDREILFKTLANIFYLFPIGFYLKVFVHKLNFIQLSFISLIISLTMGIIRFLLYTGSFDMTEAIFHLIGFLFGASLKNFIDFTVKKMTHGEIKSVLPDDFSFFNASYGRA